MKTAFIVDIVRTPIGKYGGALSSVRPDDLAAGVVRDLVKRNPSIELSQIEDVVFGAANQSGEDNRNVARMALPLAGLPASVGGVTVNRLCASGLQAIMNAAQGIMTDTGDVNIAGGVESISRAPFVLPKSEDRVRITATLIYEMQKRKVKVRACNNVYRCRTGSSCYL